MGNCSGVNCCSKETEIILKNQENGTAEISTLEKTNQRLNGANGVIHDEDTTTYGFSKEKEDTYDHNKHSSGPDNNQSPGNRDNRGLESSIALLNSRGQLNESTINKAIQDDDNSLIKQTQSSNFRIKLKPIIFENGTKYEGEWLQGKKSGSGKQVWPDGSYYEGDWKDNKANGKGKLYHVDGDIYEGEWVNDKANGYGVYNHSSGAKFVGQWENDKQNGQGLEIWPDGTQYEGNYIKGKKEGSGKLTFADNSYYEGEFQNSEIHGFGSYTWPDQRKYVGQWKFSKMHGYGRVIWKDSRSYEGQYIEDKKHGFGVFKWGDGRKYEGLWENGKQSGEGIFTNSKGEKKYGLMKEGKRLKWINSCITEESEVTDIIKQIKEYAQKQKFLNFDSKIFEYYLETNICLSPEIASKCK